MTAKNLFLCSLSSLCIGFITYAYFNHWLIIRLPHTTFNTIGAEQPDIVHKKQCKLIYWYNNNWKIEPVELIWTTNVIDNCMYLLNSWFTFLDEEQIISHKISVQTAIITASGKDLYLSFDRCPFHAQNTTFEKWMLIEGILKTLRENGITIPSVHFLEHHQPIKDHHLDFTNPWPLEGFVQSSAQ